VIDTPSGADYVVRGDWVHRGRGAALNLRRVLCGVSLLCALAASPAAANGGQSEAPLAFSAAGTVTDATGAKGPCGIAVAGSSANGVSGHGAIGGIAQELLQPASACGDIGAVQFDVVGGVVGAYGAALRIKVTASDAPGTPVGRTGTLVIEPRTATIVLSVGGFAGVFGPGRAARGTLASRATATIDARPGAATIGELAAVGVSVTNDRRFGPCVTALGATRVVTTSGQRLVAGGGSLQAVGGNGIHAGIPADPGQSACNGGVGSVGYAVTDSDGNGVGEVYGGLRVVDSTVPALTPVGTPGAYGMTAAGSKLLVGVGEQSAGWAAHTLFSFVERRAAVAVATRTVATAPPVATAGVTVFSAAGTGIDVHGTKGPCSIAVAGSLQGAVATASGTVVGTYNFADDPLSVCGGIGTTHFKVTSAALTPTGATLGITVTQSDNASAAVGTTGTIVLDKTAQYLGFSLGNYCCGLGPGHILWSGIFDQRADVRVTQLTGVSAVDRFASAGTQITNDHRFGPCTFAVAGTRTGRGAQPSVLDGGGSFAAVGGFFPGGDLANSACNGGGGAFSIAPTAPIATDGAAVAYAETIATETGDPTGVPVGTPGFFELFAATDDAKFGVAGHSGEFTNDTYTFLIRRAGVELGAWRLPAAAPPPPPTPTPDPGHVSCDGQSGHSRFSVDFDRDGRGTLEYDDGDRNVRFRAGQATSVVTGPNGATIRGTGLMNNVRVEYRAELIRGGNGSFRITLSNGYSATGDVRAGSLRLG
jgi:hypothetical protein